MRPSSLVDTRVVYCGDNLDQLAKLPDACVDLIYIDPPFNSNRNYEVFWGETKETRAFEDRHASTEAYIGYMRPRCEELHRVLKAGGDVCGLPEEEKLWKVGRGFVVRDLPWSAEKLRRIPPFEFENWAVIALGGVPNKTQVGDKGDRRQDLPSERHAREARQGNRAP
jgi:hypothetical protein